MIVTRHLLAAGLSGKSVVHGRVASHRPESVFPPDPLAPMRVCMPRSIKSRTQRLPSGGPQVSCIMCVLHPAPMRAECGHGWPGPQFNPSSHPRLLPILCGGSFVRRIAALTLLVAEIPWREPLQGQRGGGLNTSFPAFHSFIPFGHVNLYRDGAEVSGKVFQRIICSRLGARLVCACSVAVPNIRPSQLWERHTALPAEARRG